MRRSLLRLASGAVAAPAPGPSLITALTPDRILALQRTVGNRAVTALLSRDDARAHGRGRPGDSGSGGVPASSGSVTATPKGGDKVRVKAPTSSSTARRGSRRARSRSAYIGVVQNLVHSDRARSTATVATPTGEITAEHHTAEGNKSDARVGPDQDPVAAGHVRALLLEAGHDRRHDVEGNAAKATHLGTPMGSARVLDARIGRPRPDR